MRVTTIPMRLSLSKPVDLSDPAKVLPLAVLGSSTNRMPFIGHEPGQLLCVGIQTIPDVQLIPDTGESPDPNQQPYSTRGTVAVHLETDWQKRIVPGQPIDFAEIIKPYDGWTLTK